MCRSDAELLATADSRGTKLLYICNTWCNVRPFVHYCNTPIYSSGFLLEVVLDKV
jgi:hypothetical protein